jgi:hypothetical protein
VLHSHQVQLHRRRFKARCTGSSYGAEAVELESVERPKKDCHEQRGSATPLIPQPTTLVVAVIAGTRARGRSTLADDAIAGAGTRERARGRSTLAAAAGVHGRKGAPSPPRARAAELNPGRRRRGREGSSCRRGQAARGESSRLLFWDFFNVAIAV